MLTLLLLIIAVALLFNFINGFNDAANSIATLVSTRALSPLLAVAWAAFWNFAAAFVFGTAVAHAVAGGFVDLGRIGTPEQQLLVVLSGLVGATVWTYACTMLGLPISLSHALISGYAGAAIARGGLEALVVPGKWPVTLLFILAAPLLGLIGGALLMPVVAWVFRQSTPHRVDNAFRRLQLLSAAAFSASHGTNDAQKTIGMILAALQTVAAVSGYEHVRNWLAPGWTPPWFRWLGMSQDIPWWLILICYGVIALGTLAGGWRAVRTRSQGITRLQPAGGFCAETAGAITVIGASIQGIPLSTTHVITGSMMGVGTWRGIRSVQWVAGRKILLAWVFTLPTSAFIAGVTYLLVHWLVEPLIR